jgi:RNA polymerase sigma-70 factor, ECF subfamily
VKIFNLSRVNPIEGMTEAHPRRLIAECIAGNQDAIETLVREYETGVFRLALSILGDEAEAQEVTQETFLSALRALPSYREGHSLKAWLYTIALNYSRSHLRKRKVIERLHATLAAIFRLEREKQISPEEALLQNEKEAVLWRSLNELDERHRIVVILRYFHDLPVTEISEILSIPEGTVHSRLHSAREKLRDALQHLLAGHGE